MDPTGLDSIAERQILSWKALLVVTTLIVLRKEVACILVTAGTTVFQAALNAGDIQSIQPNFKTCSADVELRRRCKPCDPPVGTIGCRQDMPPTRPHRGIPGLHWHLV